MTVELAHVWTRQRVLDDRVEVRCPDCRRTRLLKKDGRPRLRLRVFPDGVCHPCANRRIAAAKLPVAADPSPDLHQWWLDRYTLDEIRALSAGLDAPDIPAVKAEPGERSLTEALLTGLPKKGQ